MKPIKPIAWRRREAEKSVDLAMAGLAAVFSRSRPLSDSTQRLCKRLERIESVVTDLRSKQFKDRELLKRFADSGGVE